MKFIVDGLDFSEALLKVSKAIGSKNVNPILEGIKISAKEDTLTLFATDLELAIEKKIKANVLEEGVAVVPGRLFGELIRKLEDEQIEITLNEKNKMKIRYTDSEGYVQCFALEDYPEPERFEKKDGFRILQLELRNAINKTLFAASSDSARPMLNGCLFQVSGYEIKTVALDGYRLAIETQPLESKSPDLRTVVPTRSLNELTKLLNDDENVVSLYLEKNYLLVDMGDTVLQTRVLVGEYLNYEQLIPKDFSTVVTVNRTQFENALDRANIMAKDEKRNNLIQFEMKENVLTMLSNSDQGSISEKMSISLEGKDLTIAFNARFLMENIRVIEDSFIQMSFTSSVAPCIITPCDKTQNEQYLYMILPVRMV